MSAHVCILSAAHLPGDGRVTHKIGRGLRDAGIRVTWVGPGTEPPDVDFGIQFHLLTPGLGWRGRFGMRKRLVEAGAKLVKVDVWFAVEPDSAMTAIVLARELGGRAVFDIHEVYHDDMLHGRVPWFLKRAVGAMVKAQLARICRKCDLIVGAGATRVQPFSDVARKSLVVHHCLSVEFSQEPAAAPFTGSRDYVRIIHGKATLSHGTLQILRAAAHVKRKGGPRLRIVMFRSFNRHERFGFADVVRTATELGVADMIEWCDPVPFERMFELLRTCDLGIIAYTQEMGRNCMPNRIFEYMAFGIPVICPTYARELVSMVNETKCGILADTEKAEVLGEAIVAVCTDRKTAREMGRRGRRAFVERFNMEKELRPFLDWVFEGVSCRSGA